MCWSYYVAVYCGNSAGLDRQLLMVFWCPLRFVQGFAIPGCALTVSGTYVPTGNAVGILTRPCCGSCTGLKGPMLPPSGTSRPDVRTQSSPACLQRGIARELSYVCTPGWRSIPYPGYRYQHAVRVLGSSVLVLRLSALTTLRALKPYQPVPAPHRQHHQAWIPYLRT